MMNNHNIPVVAIVDDNSIYRKILSRLVLEHKFQIAFEAGDGEHCLLQMKQVELLPDIIILDIEMPNMDGFKTAKLLKETWPQIRIIGHSSRNDPQTIYHMLHSGADIFQAKGCAPSELIAALQQLVPR